MPFPISKFIKKIKPKNRTFIQKVVSGIINKKSESIFPRIEKYIYGKKLLDVGVGSGGIFKYLKEKGFEMKGIDISDKSFFTDVKPIIYDGEHFEFKNNVFDTALIIHVLHHCSDALKVLEEAMRVSKRVIFIEDTYRNALEHSVISFNDALSNFELYPHFYRTPNVWRHHIKNKDWEIIHEESYSEFLYGFIYGRYVLFVIEK